MKIYELTNKWGQCLARVQARDRNDVENKVSREIWNQTYTIDGVL